MAEEFLSPAIVYPHYVEHVSIIYVDLYTQREKNMVVVEKRVYADDTVTYTYSAKP